MVFVRSTCQFHTIKMEEKNDEIYQEYSRSGFAYSRRSYQSGCRRCTEDSGKEYAGEETVVGGQSGLSAYGNYVGAERT